MNDFSTTDSPQILKNSAAHILLAGITNIPLLETDAFRNQHKATPLSLEQIEHNLESLKLRKTIYSCVTSLLVKFVESGITPEILEQVYYQSLDIIRADILEISKILVSPAEIKNPKQLQAVMESNIDLNKIRKIAIRPISNEELELCHLHMQMTASFKEAYSQAWSTAHSMYNKGDTLIPREDLIPVTNRKKEHSRLGPGGNSTAIQL